MTAKGVLSIIFLIGLIVAGSFLVGYGLELGSNAATDYCIGG